MATPEGLVKRKISKVLQAYGVYYEMPVPSGYGKQTLDYTGCHRGHYFAIEAKAPKGRTTPRQELTMATMRKAGGKVFLVRDAETLAELEDWLIDIMGMTNGHSNN